MMANIHLKAENFLEAANEAAASLKVSRKDGDSTTLIESLLLNLQCEWNRLTNFEKYGISRGGVEQLWKKLMKWAQELVGLAIRAFNKSFEANGLYWLALLHSFRGQARQVWTTADKAMKIFHDLGNINGQVNIHLLKAQTHLNEDDAVMAQKRLHEALELRESAAKMQDIDPEL